MLKYNLIFKIYINLNISLYKNKNKVVFKIKELFKETDKEEITRLLDFSSNLVILDKNKGLEGENSKTAYASSRYIAAYYNLDDYDEETRQRIISNYEELNPYYRELQITYGIEPAFARESKHLSILKANSNALSQYEEELFLDCYYESLNYYEQVISTKAFEFHPEYVNFMKLFLIWSAIQKFLSRKLNLLFNVDVYDERTLKNAFISVGLDYFDGLPIAYQRKLLKKINDLIAEKGSTQCFIDIIEIFGVDTVSISNYYLVKRFTKNIDKDGVEYYDPILEFYKTPFNQKLNTKTDEYINFEEMTINDKYWKATKEEILQKDFNIIKTNYISINSAMDITKNSIQFSYFFNWLQKAIEKNQLENTDIFNSRISNTPFNLFNGLIALITLGMRINGYKDKIVKNIDVSNYVYGYADSNNSVNIKNLVNNIKIELDKDPQIPDIDKQNLYNFVNKFNINKLEDNNYSLQEFLALFYENEETRKTLERYIYTTSNYKIVKYLNQIKDLELRTSTNNTLFSGYETYSEYLKYNSLNLYNFINIDSSVYSNEQELYFAIKEKMNELVSSITSQLYNKELGESISKNTQFGINNYLEYYVKTLIMLFKPYSMEIVNNMNYYDMKDKDFHFCDYVEKYFAKTGAEYIGLVDTIEFEKTK